MTILYFLKPNPILLHLSSGQYLDSPLMISFCVIFGQHFLFFCNIWSYFSPFTSHLSGQYSLFVKIDEIRKKNMNMKTYFYDSKNTPFDIDHCRGPARTCWWQQWPSVHFSLRPLVYSTVLFVKTQLVTSHD